MNILLVTERSAGHIFPAFAIGKAIIDKSQERKIFVFTTSSGLKKHVKEQGFVSIGRCFSKRNILIEGIWRFFESFYILFKVRPGIVIGFGGRDSFFLVLFSCFFFIKTFIYEPNISFGKANKFLSRFVTCVWRGLGETKNEKKTKVIGIPLRKELLKIKKIEARKLLKFDDRPLIFCFGGSQGSVFINELFLRFVKRAGEDIQVIHLTGPDEYYQIKDFYNKIKNKIFISDFYYQMNILYGAADVVLCRAGAATLGEISYFATPSVLIPHPSSGGHQKENAEFFKKHEAALVYEQETIDFDSFAGSLLGVAKSEDLQQKLINNLSRVKGGIGFEDFRTSFNF